MKNFLFLTFSLIAILQTARGQQSQPIYIEYTPGCMNQLEYRYTNAQSNPVPAYSVWANALQQYVLIGAAPGINSPSLPRNMYRCQDLPNVEALLDMINLKTRAVYMVHQTANGYYMMPLAAAAKITRQGSYYVYQGPAYSFALDTLRLKPGVNLSNTNSTSFVFYTGQAYRGCATEYTFRREPTATNNVSSDFDFIPGIGITRDRTGASVREAENNEIRLTGINGRLLDEYVTGNCPDLKNRRPGNTVSSYTQPNRYGPDTRFQPEQDKEIVSMQQQPVYNDPQNPQTYSTPGVRMANCPNQPGAGYHVVQPGENLAAIARTYQVSLGDLIKWNKIKDADKINVCQKIYLSTPPPNADLTAPSPNTYSTGSTRQAKGVMDQRSLWTNGGTYNAPQLYSTPNTTDGQRTIHTVQKGESVFSIAKRYGITEERLRMLNNFPANGNVPIWPGDQLTVCNCQINETGNNTPNPITYDYRRQDPPVQSQFEGKGGYSTGIGVPPVTQNTDYGNNTYQPQTERFDENQRIDNSQPNRYDYNGSPYQNRGNSTAVPYNERSTDPYTTPQYSQRPTDPYANSPYYDQNNPAGSSNLPPRPPVYQEYFVKQGDTIGSIANQFRVSANEIAAVNQKQIKETLVAGQRILVPKY